MLRRSIAVVSLLLAVVLSTSAALAEPKSLKLDTAHSRIGFSAATLLFDVTGHFGKFDVQVDGDPKDPGKAKLIVSIDTASIDTQIGKRDEHLRGADFFDAKAFPKITFTSQSITVNGNALIVTGTLDMHGKQKKLTIPFKVVRGKNGAGVDTTAYKGKLGINRNDFGIGADSVAAKLSLEDEVTLDLLIVAFLG